MASYLLEEDVCNYSNLRGVRDSLTDEDVATLLETYENVIMSYSGEYIKDILTDGSHFYYVIGNTISDFDLFGYINSRRRGNSIINCVNARLLFGRSLSKGIGSLDIPDVEDDPPTSYMESVGLTIPTTLIHNGNNIAIPKGGLIIGRSAKKADYLISDDTDVSRVHCRVYFKNGKCYVEDLGSLNGTYIDGLKVKAESELTVGSVLKVAEQEFRVL